MVIRDRSHANMSKQTTTLADIDVTPQLGLAYGQVILLFSIVWEKFLLCGQTLWFKGDVVLIKQTT